MSTKKENGKTIWDVIFSLDSSHFPIQRNFLNEPRGSLNSINRLVTQEICQKTVEDVRKTYPEPNDLYALDFELNYTIRKLADFILYADLREFNCWDWEGSDVLILPLDDALSFFSQLCNLDEDYFCYIDFETDIVDLTHTRNENNTIEWDRLDYRHMADASKFQQAVQYVIENSDIDWKTRAEAFLRASSNRGYSPADDETIIYLMSQNINDEELEKEAKHRWEQYKKEWEGLFFTEKNPFDGEFSVDRLRLIHWDKLGKLRILEPLMKKLPDDTTYYDYLKALNACRETYSYKVGSQHLLSPDFLSDYVKVFSLIRADLDVDPIRSYHGKLVEKFYGFLSGSRESEYNYTVTDIHYLSDLLYTFTRYRFQLSTASKDDRSFFGYEARMNIEFSFNSSTSKFLANIPMTTLIALEVHVVYYSRPKGTIDFLQKAKQWLLSQQNPYGYWYDGVNNPEYTTVLVLDAINLIDEEDGLSFPKKTIPKKDDNIIEIMPYSLLLVNFLSRSLFIGSKEITFRFRGGENKTWDFIKALIAAKQKKMPLPRYLWTKTKQDEDDIPEIDKQDRHDWKNQYDTLSRQLGGPEIIKQFIKSSGDSYYFSQNVVITNHSTIKYRADSDLLNNL